jgi:hypothetical protein
VWRWLGPGGGWVREVAGSGRWRPGRAPYRLTGTDREAYAYIQGNVAAVHRARTAVVSGAASAAGVAYRTSCEPPLNRAITHLTGRARAPARIRLQTWSRRPLLIARGSARRSSYKSSGAEPARVGRGTAQPEQPGTVGAGTVRARLGVVRA